MKLSFSRVKFNSFSSVPCGKTAVTFGRSHIDFFAIYSWSFADLFFCEASLTLPRCSSVSSIENAAWSLSGARRGRADKKVKAAVTSAAYTIWTNIPFDALFCQRVLTPRGSHSTATRPWSTAEPYVGLLYAPLWHLNIQYFMLRLASQTCAEITSLL